MLQVDTALSSTVTYTDLGLTVSVDMNVSEQCGFAALRGN